MSKTKFLWIAALAMLGLSIMAGAASAVVGWDVTAENIPDSMIWDQPLAVVLDTENTGTDPYPDAWLETYGLVSVDQVITPASVAAVDRWGVTTVPIAGRVNATDDRTSALEGLYTWAFDIVAPPISPITYVGGAPFGKKVDNKWLLADGGVTFDTLTAAGNAVALTRFPDMGTDALMAWATGGVEECAGRLPRIVGGYPDGLYHPEVPVDRGQMAVFIQRALDLPTAAYAAVFPDVLSDTFGAAEIEALNAASIVGGYPDGWYWPTIVVNRGQMAAFIARGLEGGDAGIPSYTGTPHFPDVTPTTPDAWFLKYVEYCREAGIVGGYPDGTYQCGITVDRGQMALFIYRGFISPSPAVVVVGGVGVTNAAALSLADCSTAADNPATGYVILDTARLHGTSPAVVFQVTDGGGVAVGGPIAAASAAFEDYGTAYTCAIPALADGDYKLTATVDGMAVNHQAAFSVGAVTPPALETAVRYPSEDGTLLNGNGTSSGAVTNLNASDDMYVTVTPNATWQCGGVFVVPCPYTSAQLYRLDLEVVAKSDRAMHSPEQTLNISTSGMNGYTRWIAGGDFAGADADATVTYTTANRAKFVDIFRISGYSTLVGRIWVYVCCGCADSEQDGVLDPGMTGDFTLGVDMIKVTYTRRPGT